MQTATKISIDTDALDDIFRLAASAQRAIRFHLADGSTKTMDSPRWSINGGDAYEGRREGDRVLVAAAHVVSVSLLTL